MSAAVYSSGTTSSGPIGNKELGPNTDAPILGKAVAWCKLKQKQKVNKE